MKKVLLISFVLVICILAFPQGVLAAPPTSAGVVVNANFGDMVSLVTSTPTVPWNLNYDTPQYVNTYPNAIDLTADANGPWHVTVWGSNAGKLTDPGVAGSLTNELTMKAAAHPTYADVGTTAATAVEIEDGVLGVTNFKGDLQQTLDILHDVPSTAYTITLTFDIIVGT